jgi:hypothetical protein
VLLLMLLLWHDAVWRRCFASAVMVCQRMLAGFCVVWFWQLSRMQECAGY